MPLRREDANATPCAIQASPGRTCYEPAHVVLFAETAQEFAGVLYAPGDRVLACLEHGGQIYDGLRSLTGRHDVVKAGPVAAWLRYEMARKSLPQPRMVWHHRSETPRVSRPKAARIGAGNAPKPRRTEPWR